MREFAKYNDGVVSIFKEKPKRSTFGAKENTENVGDLEFICKLDFEELSKRQEDQEFAQRNGFSLNMKIRTRFVDKVKSHYKALIDTTLYDISAIDKTKTEMFLYMEEERTLDT
jgi:SPP1 family predicted phage head-tail adaptor